MAKINKANLKKAYYYLKRNGLRGTYLAALERLQKNNEDYIFTEISEEEYALERAFSKEHSEICFSILVPAFHTKPEFLKACIDSVLAQSYENWELILADAGANDSEANSAAEDSVEAIVKTYQDSRIQYLRLKENAGISENTNAALQVATGDYIGLLDHDDVLTKNALYENAKAIYEAGKAGINLKLLYSDEDKCDGAGEKMYEPHHKPNFNLDLLLSNNYICHFTVMQAELMKKLGFRKAYDGAQDYDLALRAVIHILKQETAEGKTLLGVDAGEIAHISKILYHWRCHESSTAENPQSKQYAYEAGKNALEDFYKAAGIKAIVSHTAHLGFYETKYAENLFAARPDIGMVGGPLYSGKKKICGGIYEKNGKCPYAGLKRGFSGYMHRAILSQEAYAVDVRNMGLREEFGEAYEALCEKYFALGELCDSSTDNREIEKNLEKKYRKLSMELSKEVRKRGYRVVYNGGDTKL